MVRLWIWLFVREIVFFSLLILVFFFSLSFCCQLEIRILFCYYECYYSCTFQFNSVLVQCTLYTVCKFYLFSISFTPYYAIQNVKSKMHLSFAPILVFSCEQWKKSENFESDISKAVTSTSTTK